MSESEKQNYIDIKTTTENKGDPRQPYNLSLSCGGVEISGVEEVEIGKISADGGFIKAKITVLVSIGES